jgi:polyketide biosynthesis enoyl-CoA hydratase PksH
MEFTTIKVEFNNDAKVMVITFGRPESNNAINIKMLDEINHALDKAEKVQEIRTILLKGNDTFFCSGMDFKEASEENEFPKRYSKTLKRFATISKTVVSICEGKVIAGGVGFVAASDIVIAHPSAFFHLTELIWGLLPANVLPYLIRRVGFQPSYLMTLTTSKVSAKEAKEIHLVDILIDKPHQEFEKLNKRLSSIQPQTIGAMKTYFRKMWIINDEMEKLAMKTLEELKTEPHVQQNIRNYVEKGILPWEVA